MILETQPHPMGTALRRDGRLLDHGIPRGGHVELSRASNGRVRVLARSRNGSVVREVFLDLASPDGPVTAREL